MKKHIENSFNYLEASMPPKAKFNGFAGEPITTAKVMAMAKITPTARNHVFMSKVSNA